MTDEFEPTAAIAAEDENLPTTAKSAELNNCCNMELRAKGKAKKNILSAKLPSSMFI